MLANNIFMVLQEQIMPFVSSIFLRRLFLPGVYNNNVLRATLLDYNKHWTDSEFQSLNADRLKTEIISLVEHEVLASLLFYYMFHLCPSRGDAMSIVV